MRAEDLGQNPLTGSADLVDIATACPRPAFPSCSRVSFPSFLASIYQIWACPYLPELGGSVLCRSGPYYLPVGSPVS